MMQTNGVTETNYPSRLVAEVEDRIIRETDEMKNQDTARQVGRKALRPRPVNIGNYIHSILHDAPEYLSTESASVLAMRQLATQARTSFSGVVDGEETEGKASALASDYFAGLVTDEVFPDTAVFRIGATEGRRISIRKFNPAEEEN
eukprot:TRINITY_DN16489_c0_g1_i2.p1 TRINITY_DN16489_c0_g1~~TRINITY_DN16489_c0_g1_i2.p1  ORF type:complete len:147 (-),score=11.83 TRINITY_DN16489_c0_g1_i2:439-879(-)